MATYENDKDYDLIVAVLEGRDKADEFFTAVKSSEDSGAFTIKEAATFTREESGQIRLNNKGYVAGWKGGGSVSESASSWEDPLALPQLVGCRVHARSRAAEDTRRDRREIGPEQSAIALMLEDRSTGTYFARLGTHSVPNCSWPSCAANRWRSWRSSPRTRMSSRPPRKSSTTSSPSSPVCGATINPPGAIPSGRRQWCLGHHCRSGRLEPRLESVPQSEPTPPIDIHQHEKEVISHEEHAIRRRWHSALLELRITGIHREARSGRPSRSSTAPHESGGYRPMIDSVLPSWRAGLTRTAIVDFLDRVDVIPPTERVAVFDNDGTLWCENLSTRSLSSWWASCEGRSRLSRVSAIVRSIERFCPATARHWPAWAWSGSSSRW